MFKMKKMKYTTARKCNAFLYTLPWVIGFFMFFAIPLVNTIIYSFSKVDVGDSGGMELTFTGLSNYINLFTSELSKSNITFVRIFSDENIRIVTNAPIIVIFSLFLAILANLKFKGRGLVRVIFFIPIILGLDIITTLIAVSTGGELTTYRSSGIFSEGIASYLLMKYTNLSQNLVYTITGYVDNIFELISQAGVQTLIYLAGLQSISPSLYEVAKIEGANAYEMFWKVTIPSIFNVTMFVSIYTIIELFLKSSLTEEIYHFAFVKSKIGVGSALSVVFMVNVLILLALFLCLLGRMVKKNEARD